MEYCVRYVLMPDIPLIIDDPLLNVIGLIVRLVYVFNISNM